MLNRIDRLLPTLSRAEQRVGRWIIAHPRAAADATVAEVAAAAGTSQPTVVRFCRSAGLEGFRALRMRLAEALSRPDSFVHRDVTRSDSTSDAVSKVVDRSIHVLNDLRASFSVLPLDAAVERLVNARQLSFMGNGASGHVAADACHKFFRLGMPCQALTDVPTMRQYAAIASPDDVVVAISQSGSSAGIIAAARTARQSGAAVIAVTASGTQLAEHADCLLDLPIIDDKGVFTPMSSRLAHLVLLDALQVAVALRLGDTAEQRLRRCKDALSDDYPPA